MPPIKYVTTDQTRRVIEFTRCHTLSKAQFGKETANACAPLVTERAACQIVGDDPQPIQSRMTIDKSGDVLPFVDARRMFRDLTDVGGKIDPNCDVSDMSLAELAKFSGAELLASFGARLREARKERRLKQEEIGALVGVTRQTVAAWESHRSYPDSLSEGRVRSIADTLNVRYEWLRFGQEPMREVDSRAAMSSAALVTGDELKAKLRSILKDLRPIVRKIEDLIEE